MKPTDNAKNETRGINSEEVRKALTEQAGMKLTDGELETVSGGYMLWGKTCKSCGGVINNDPNTPYDIRCHCNEDNTPVWGPKPR